MTLVSAQALPVRLARVLRTVRWLTPRQVAYRVWTTGRLGLYGYVPAAASVGLWRDARFDARGGALMRAWLAQKFPGGATERHLRTAADVAASRFCFLNRAVEGGALAVDWRAPGMTRLWQYHLHYAEYVTALALGASWTGRREWAERAWALIADWIDANPPGARPGWEPYPLSLRLVNWAAALGPLTATPTGSASVERTIASIAAQARFLSRHLEYHLGGNHVIKNAKALLIASLVVDSADAERWRDRARAILRTELRRQVLADGGHFERSPLYHGQVLEDVLDCLAVGTVDGAAATFTTEEIRELTETAGRMTRWLEIMLHPDGSLPLFNDCVSSGDIPPRALLEYARRMLPVPDVEPDAADELGSSGYYVLRSGPSRVVVDCGPIGPDELPAHAHADTLSYELVWDGDHVVVDSGTAEYALDDLRRYVRSTRAHNTVMIDGVEQSEVWASHRVGRRARPLGARVSRCGDGVLFTGAHDGYARLGVTHHRHLFGLAGAWMVVDDLRGDGRHRFESFVHVGPGFVVEEVGDVQWQLAGPRRRFLIRPLGRWNAEWGVGWHCPDWGRVLRNFVLRVSGEAALPVVLGYLLVPAGVTAEVDVAADDTAVTLVGRIGDHRFRQRSMRCTSFS